MPRGVVLFVKLLLDKGSYVFLHVVLLQRLQQVITSSHMVDLDVFGESASATLGVWDAAQTKDRVSNSSAADWSQPCYAL